MKKKIDENPDQILKSIKKKAKRVYEITFHEDSLLSWVFNLILAFILVRFIIYPGLSLALATDFPVVTVITGSMVQEGSFQEWWDSPISLTETQGDFYEKYNITKEDFNQFPFNSGFNVGDIIILRGKNPEDIKVGDVMVFQSELDKPIIHRVIEKWEEEGKMYYKTKGDNNEKVISGDGVNEDRISENRVLGIGKVRIPYLGWVKLSIVNFTRCLLTGNIGIVC